MPSYPGGPYGGDEIQRKRKRETLESTKPLLKPPEDEKPLKSSKLKRELAGLPSKEAEGPAKRKREKVKDGRGYKFEGDTRDGALKEGLSRTASLEAKRTKNTETTSVMDSTKGNQENDYLKNLRFLVSFKLETEQGIEKYNQNLLG